MQLLAKQNPALKEFLVTTPRGELSINFHDPKAVLCLNQGLLRTYYGVQFWQIPEGYLCPPIPGRADYIHHLAELLTQSGAPTQTVRLPSQTNKSAQPKVQMDAASQKIQVLDVGTGANCIYPILGSQSYGWQFVGTDMNAIAIKSAKFIVQTNSNLKNKIQFRLQKNPSNIFAGIIKKTDFFDVSMCNPPFHESLEAAAAGSQRKLNNLNKGKKTKPNKELVLNFAGIKQELSYDGGEIAFLNTMAEESKDFAQQVGWFTSLISKKENVSLLHQNLQKLGAKQVRVVEMAQGQKISRFMAWSFFSKADLAEYLSRESISD